MAVGKGFTVTVALPLWAWLHIVDEASFTLNKMYSNVPDSFVGTSKLMLLPFVVVIVCSEPLLILYVNVYGAVPIAPVNVILGEVAFLQTTVPPVMVAVGKGFTVTVVLPLWA